MKASITLYALKILLNTTYNYILQETNIVNESTVVMVILKLYVW